MAKPIVDVDKRMGDWHLCRYAQGGLQGHHAQFIRTLWNAEMAQPLSYLCNALIEGRQPRALLRFTDLFGVGNWIQGTVTLSDEHVRFSTTRLNARLQEDGSDLILPYRDVTACSLGRLAYVLKTVDLETTQSGVVRFRCLFAWNERLLEELQNRVR